MLNGVSVQLERRLWLTVEGHILSFGCADFKSKVCCGISGPRAETGPVGWKTQGERYHQQSRSFSNLAGYLLDRRGQVPTPESGPDAFPKR